MNTRNTTSKAPFRSHLLPAVAVGILLLFANSQSAAGLTIIRDFIGGAPGTNDTGTGNLPGIFNAAADVWQQIILDDHVLTLHYGWTPNGGGEHYLNAQGGTPNRETEGTILFNNDNVVGHHHYYLDPTPRLNEEFPNSTQITQNMGSGGLNVTRVFSGGIGDAGSEDLFTTALHEIGHALGMSLANTSFIAKSADGRIEITSPRPFAGTSVPLATNYFGVTSHIDYVAERVLMAGFGAGERVLPSTLDIIALAELSQFQKLNFDLAPKLTIGATGTNVSIAWAPVVPGFLLKATDKLSLTNWQTVQQPVVITNGISTVSLAATGSGQWFRLNLATNFGLTVSSSHDAVDVNPSHAGVQVHTGTTIHYSGAASDSSGNPPTWQWFYAVDGGPWNIVQSGTGTVPTVSYTYGAGSVGSTYVWTLWVISGPRSGQSHSTITVE
jgi:hypothetical protein